MVIIGVGSRVEIWSKELWDEYNDSAYEDYENTLENLRRLYIKMILQQRHISVLLEECIQNLKLSEGKTIIDATMGGGGHSLEIVKRILPGGRLIGVDKDEEAIARCKQRLKEYEDSITYIKSDFKNIKGEITTMFPNGVDGILADLGVSSFQLEDAKKGFFL